jgi:hypothetical protein
MNIRINRIKTVKERNLKNKENMFLCRSFSQVLTSRNQREAFCACVQTNTYKPSIQRKDRWILPESLPTHAAILQHILEALPVSNFRALPEMNRKKQNMRWCINSRAEMFYSIYRMSVCGSN